MKTSMYVALFALTASINAFAIPPIPPSPVLSEPVIVKCEDYNSLTAIELQELEEDTSRIISLDQESREICHRIN